MTWTVNLIIKQFKEKKKIMKKSFAQREITNRIVSSQSHNIDRNLRLKFVIHACKDITDNRKRGR